jgi:hypothetical protein
VSIAALRRLNTLWIGKLCAGTQRGHIRSCKRFAAFLNRSPDTATTEDIRRFQLHLAEAGVSICNRNRIMPGLRFLFRVTLRRLDLAGEIYHIREPQKIPSHRRSRQAMFQMLGVFAEFEKIGADEIERGTHLFWLDVDHFGIARAEPAQFIAYQFRVGFLFEERLPCVVGTPPVVTAVIPAEGFRVGPGSKGDTVGHRLLPLRGWSHRVRALAGRSISPIVGIKPVGDQNRQARAGLRAADL